ncbi:hypothetical protein KUTeg_003389 [Tegillarca granosa]|uniref:Uncharacterized protein n=1 Tax=Tegillarca granosa TaxID=220873 RepID=A0ABQ9FRJ5_TEGGR|nr:hypothetical protein KUTeg_003389 [Tegillarca granosa]
MADVSLDDYMKKNTNFRVQISNPNAQRNKNQRFNQGGKSQIKNRLGLQQKSFPKVQISNNLAGNAQIKNRLGQKGLQTKGFQTKQGLQTKHGLQTNKTSTVQMSVTLQGANRITFDARDKIATNKQPKDARERLNQGRGSKFKNGKIQITPKPADARVKLNQGRQTTNSKFKETKIQITNTAAVKQQANSVNLVTTYNQGIGENTNNLVRTINSGTSPGNPLMTSPPPVVQYQTDPYQDTSIPSYNPVHHNIPMQTVYQDVPAQPMYQDLPVMRVNQDISPVHMMNQNVLVQQYTDNISRTNTVPSDYHNMSVQRSQTGQYSYEECYDDDDEEDDSFYDKDDSLQYSVPVPKQTVMEKTLTVKKPVKITQTVVKEKIPVAMAVKRKAPGSVGGPLKLYKPPPSESSPPKKIKTSIRPMVTTDLLHDDYTEEQADESVNILSPLQGYKSELFGAIGPMKKARLPKPGLAEIPMQVKVLTSTVAQVKQAVLDSPLLDKPSGEPLKLGKNAPKKDSNVDMSLVHKALFKTSSAGTTKPVTFTSEHLVIPFSEITTSSKDYIDGLTVVLIYTGII